MSDTASDAAELNMPPTVDRAKRDEHDSAHKTPEEVTTKSAIHSPIVSNSRITLVGFYLLLSFKPLQDSSVDFDGEATGTSLDVQY